ncbi:hypothetical protein [Flavobacterium reichenbachii]|uniref:Uncharacterized protein n=1 Tax=Flavobacterium reichenbachii TaxID=362418 RepID=A0A085ZRC8_9FLAO|nr:hypothetical protein [Flavobacterium reichenbachii]KFF06992.1 hypothetical protein IW19_16385 [Flavobacterium reichenbachii]OXB12035.1 hypothetical protein B0A68_20115 [Flavobacterium reichenbachii]
MNTLDINTIAFQYLLRTDSQKNKNKSEEPISEALKYDPEHYIKGQKSLLSQMYTLEEEDLYV